MNFPPKRPRLVFLAAFACVGNMQADLHAGFHCVFFNLHFVHVLCIQCSSRRTIEHLMFELLLFFPCVCGAHMLLVYSVVYACGSQRLMLKHPLLLFSLLSEPGLSLNLELIISTTLGGH